MTPLDFAIQLALKHHTGIYRAQGDNPIALPSITHPLAVLKRIWQWGVEYEATLIAAVLHDTVEDTNLTLDQIDTHFGPTVANIVKQLTFKPDPELDKVEKAKLKKLYIKTFATADIKALVIKFADRLENVTDFQVTSPSYAKKYYYKAEDLFTAFVEREKEIIAEFGEKVFLAMLIDWKLIKTFLSIV